MPIYLQLHAILHRCQVQATELGLNQAELVAGAVAVCRRRTAAEKQRYRRCEVRGQLSI